MKNTTNIKLTENASIFLNTSMEKEKNNNLNLYLSVIYPLTKYAHVSIIYCTEQDINKKDIKIIINNIILYIDYKSYKYLNNAIIDIKNNKLSIYAPNIFLENFKTDLTIDEKIKHLFENEINTVLSQHGGFIELVNIENNDTITIKFHGGCQGCGMVNFTLSNYIEKIIKKNFPNIITIKDITMHNLKYNPYY